jgi:hopanoid biosynthesis associated RND transporter like protein HpnN
MVSLLLYAVMRSYRLVLTTVVTLLAGLVWTASAAGAMVGHLNVISTSFTVLFIGLSVDFGLHYFMRYQELCLAGASHDDALRESARGVGSSILLCGVTTAIGFYAFVPTDFSGVAELGLIAGTGIFIAQFLCFTMLPAMATWLVGSGHSMRSDARGIPLQALPGLATSYPRTVSLGALLVGLAALSVIPRVHFDNNPVRVRDPSAESVQALEDLVSRGGQSPWDMSAVAPDLDSAERLAERLRALPEVERAVTVRDFVPRDQDEKLAILEDVAMFLAPPPGRAATAPSASEQMEALVRLEHELDKLASDAPASELAGAAAALGRSLGSLRTRLVGLDDGRRAAALESLQESLLGLLPDQLALLERAVAVEPVALEDLPPTLVERMLAPGGQARVRISPREDLTDNAALARFVAAVQSVEPTATGSAAGIYEFGRTAVRAFQQALGSAVLVIVVLVFLIWRTIGDTLLVMVPLLLAGLLTGAASVLLGIPFNLADVIVLPLLLGIGVDSGIHLVHRARHGGGGGAHLLETSTARAVLYSSLTTVASFGTLAFAGHRGIASIGALLSVGVALALVCNLFILPALIELRLQLQVRRASRRPGQI